MKQQVRKLQDIVINENKFNRSNSVRVAVGELEFDVSFNSDGTVRENSQINTLKLAGIELDFEELKNEFLELQTVLDEEKKQKEITRKEKLWDESWVHACILNLKTNYPNVKIEPNETKERFLDPKNYSDYLTLCLSYKSEEGYLAKRSKHGAIHFELGGTVLDYKTRRYSTVEKAVKTFVKLVEEKIKAKEYKENSLKRKEANEQQMRQELESRLERPVTIEKVWKSSNYGIRRSRGYEVTEYRTVLNIKTGEEVNKRMVGISSNKELDSLTFNGITTTFEKAKEIFSILES